MRRVELIKRDMEPCTQRKARGQQGGWAQCRVVGRQGHAGTLGSEGKEGTEGTARLGGRWGLQRRQLRRDGVSPV